MISNIRTIIFFMGLFFIAPVIGMSKQDNHDMLFLWQTLSQGNFAITFPIELRKIIWEYAVKERISLCNSLIREIHLIDLSLFDVAYCNRSHLDGIRVLNAACASKIYDLNWKLRRSTCHISKKEYENACAVPQGMKRRFEQEKTGDVTCSFKRVLVLVGNKHGNDQKKILSLR